MTPSFTPADGLLATLDLLRIECADAVLHVRLNRPAKRNALNDTLVAQLHTCLVNLPEAVRAVVLTGAGDHFCAGLDLSELSERSVAEDSTFYGLPEGQRGIFVGGGGSARIPRLAGVACMTDMMLTGRTRSAVDGVQRGLSQYLVADGAGVAKGCELAARMAGNAPLSNFAVMQALPRIADLSQPDGLFVESLMAAIAQGDDAAKQRVRAFLEKRAAKVEKPA